jgi:hypothetical protein
LSFEPQPPNDFRRFIETYFERCRAVCPKLEAIAGKWTFEDLIPGLSDFDTRFIFADDTTVEEWFETSIAVGQVHTRLAKESPDWARILEHLPGLNLTRAEVMDPRTYYPEFQQWTYYRGEAGLIDAVRAYLGEKPWGRRDEIFHLKKFATYYGPYLRGIDPPVNIGRWENKYPLHSRFMHYFTPPVQSALSLVRRKGVCGKLDALRGARDVFPHPEIIGLTLEAVDRHYEIPRYYQEPELTEIEKRLATYLRDVCGELAGHVTLIDFPPGVTPEELRSRIAAIPADPRERFFEGAKFCRLMKGRLLFYAEEIPGFETSWLIRNELGRIVRNFYDQPLTTFALACFGESVSAAQALDRLRGDVLPAEICDGVASFVRVAQSPLSDGEEKLRARRVADVFEPVHAMLEILDTELSRADAEETGQR